MGTGGLATRYVLSVDVQGSIPWSPAKQHARSSGTGVAPTKRDDEGSTPSLGSTPAKYLYLSGGPYVSGRII